MIKMIKEYSKCLFALLLSTLIITLSLCFLAQSGDASKTSFSASQIYKMTGASEDDGEVSSKITEEIVNVFGS